VGAEEEIAPRWWSRRHRHRHLSCRSISPTAANSSVLEIQGHGFINAGCLASSWRLVDYLWAYLGRTRTTVNVNEHNSCQQRDNGFSCAVQTMRIVSSCQDCTTPTWLRDIRAATCTYGIRAMVYLVLATILYLASKHNIPMHSAQCLVLACSWISITIFSSWGTSVTEWDPCTGWLLTTTSVPWLALWHSTTAHRSITVTWLPLLLMRFLTDWSVGVADAELICF
jgi:hypothetical protein